MSYDIRLDDELTGSSIFVEVKTTVTADRQIFPISGAELLCAQDHEAACTYWVVRVYSSGTEGVTMHKVESLMSQVEQGAIGEYAEDFTRPLAYFSMLTFKPPMLKVPAAPISTSGYQELSKKTIKTYDKLQSIQMLSLLRPRSPGLFVGVLLNGRSKYSGAEVINSLSICI